jgi:hypothetical protein
VVPLCPTLPWAQAAWLLLSLLLLLWLPYLHCGSIAAAAIAAAEYSVLQIKFHVRVVFLWRLLP